MSTAGQDGETAGPVIEEVEGGLGGLGSGSVAGGNLRTGGGRQGLTLRSAQAQREHDLILDLGYDMECRRYACLALGNLASVGANHALLLDCGMLEAVRESLLVTKKTKRKK